MPDLLIKVDQQYIVNKYKFDLQLESKNWESLYHELKQFEVFDERYFKIRNKTMGLMEKYIRRNPGEFILP